ncbi:hypothetical protein ACFFX0_08040 [Citricoccus parietis]|uniref:Uncharacterized protein n=1 Tax=Citricoccus parietis TaxID=592307 RepID=A0ABV5FWU7_9MICC
MGQAGAGPLGGRARGWWRQPRVVRPGVPDRDRAGLRGDPRGPATLVGQVLRGRAAAHVSAGPGRRQPGSRP